MKSLLSSTPLLPPHRAPRFGADVLSLVAVALFLLGPASAPHVQAAAPPSDQAIIHPDDASQVPVFFPFTDSQGRSITSVSGRVGLSLTQQVAATDTQSSGGYSATGLPAGLVIDPDSGLISGTPTESGTFPVMLSASNAAGVGTATLPFVIAPPLPDITVTAEVPSAFPAQGVIGDFLLTRTGDSSEPLSVNILVQGSAKNGVDYTAISLVKKFKAGKSVKRVHINASNESGQGITKKTVKLTLEPFPTTYNLGDSTVAKIKIFYTP